MEPHFHSKDIHFDFIKFKFISSIDELLNYHPIYMYIYNWLNNKYANEFWDLYEYTEIINTGFFYYFLILTYKHPEVEWPDIENDLAPIVKEDVGYDEVKYHAVMIIIAVLLFSHTSHVKVFKHKYKLFISSYKNDIKDISLPLAKLIDEKKMPKPKFLLVLREDTTKRFLKLHGAYGCYVINKYFDEKSDEKELESHLNDVVKSLFEEVKNDEEGTMYYFDKLSYAVMKKGTGYEYSPTFYFECECDPYIVSLEDSKYEKKLKRANKQKNLQNKPSSKDNTMNTLNANEIRVMQFLSDGNEHFDEPYIEDYDEICEYLAEQGLVNLGETKDNGIKLTYKGKKLWQEYKQEDSMTEMEYVILNTLLHHGSEINSKYKDESKQIYDFEEIKQHLYTESEITACSLLMKEKGWIYCFVDGGPAYWHELKDAGIIAMRNYLKDKQEKNSSDSQIVNTPSHEDANQETPSSNNKLSFDHLPPKLSTPRAKDLWEKLYKAGYVDNRCITLRSRTESAIMAKEMAVKLGLRIFWSEFSDLWNIPNLKSSYSKSHDRQSCWNFEKDFLQVLE